MFAHVIVDIPARQTNRPFTYSVPSEMTALVAPGSRVTVPFAGRKLQGIIVELAATSELAAAKIKPLLQLLDVTPTLSDELVQLAGWLSDTYFCPLIFSLQAMMPKALKAKYDKRLVLDEQQLSSQLFLSAQEQQLVALVRKRKNVSLAVLLRQQPDAADALRSLVEQKILHEEMEINEQTRIRRRKWVRPLLSAQEFAQRALATKANAVRLKKLYAFFATNSESLVLADLCRMLDIPPALVERLAAAGDVQIEEEELYRDPYGQHHFAPSVPLPLTAQQTEVMNALVQAISAGRYARFLLHGVTGSGKTEVYLQLIARVLQEQRQAIVLVPEIALTPQMAERFKRRFGERVAVLHSRLSDGERYDEWRKIRRGQVEVAVGARSAVFAPFARLGLIIIDEEHEHSYKQEETPKYATKEVAEQRCRHHQATLMLASATPSLETFADPGTRLVMSERVQGLPMPAVQIVDMRAEFRDGHRSLFSGPLRAALADRLKRGEQTILLLNRRGYHTFVMCRDCGHVCQCPHCEISLTFHQRDGRMRCHYCGHEQSAVESCPACKSANIRFFGTGTQKVEEQLLLDFPGMRVIRMDVDTTATKGAHERLLSSFAAGEADVLLGTQMIGKGLDFPNVTLAGVIAADTTLHLPDFRAAERTFQLLTQLAGRAGRAEKAGEVIIQTFNPEHYSIQLASAHDYEAFARKELGYRKLLTYPPYCRLLLVNLSHEQRGLLVQASEAAGRWLREYGTQHAAHTLFEVLGPTPAPLAKLKDRYRYQCMVKYNRDFSIKAMLNGFAAQMSSWMTDEQLHIQLDIDPQMMM
jgi:primosomal protein N' (replication factor Y)